MALLAEHFAALQSRSLAREVLALLLRYNWPGNVRELQAVLEPAAVLSPDGTVGREAVAEAIALGRASPNGDGGWFPSGEPDDRAVLMQL